MLREGLLEQARKISRRYIWSESMNSSLSWNLKRFKLNHRCCRRSGRRVEWLFSEIPICWKRTIWPSLRSAKPNEYLWRHYCVKKVLSPRFVEMKSLTCILLLKKSLLGPSEIHWNLRAWSETVLGYVVQLWPLYRVPWFDSQRWIVSPQMSVVYCGFTYEEYRVHQSATRVSVQTSKWLSKVNSSKSKMSTCLLNHYIFSIIPQRKPIDLF